MYYGALAVLVVADGRQDGRQPSAPARGADPSCAAVIDEIGYLPVSQDGAMLFFQLVNARHERASTALTSNKGVEGWGGVLPRPPRNAERTSTGNRRRIAALLPEECAISTCQKCTISS